MKFEWNKKYAQVAFWVCVVILFTVISVFFFWNYNDFGTYISDFVKVLNPIIYGVVIAYVLNKVMKIYENKVFRFLDGKPGKMRFKRVISIICTYITMIALIAGFIWLIAPQIIAGFTELQYTIPLYMEDVETWMLNLSEENQALHDLVFDAFDYVNSLMERIGELMEVVAPQIMSWLSQILTFFKDLIIGIILSVYFLMQKERFIAQGNRFVRAVFSEEKYHGAISLMKQVDNSFGGYLVAMGLDSMLVMVECFILFGLAGIPYYPLISFIIGVTNFIPFFGPFIGAIPSAFIIFIVDPLKVLLFIFLIVVIQQVDGNIIAPKIIGSHIGISSVWVVIAVTVMSGFFGFVGMIIGVPLFSVIYTLIDNALAKKLENKNCDTDIIDFYSDDNMGKTMEMEMMDAELYRASKVPLHTKIFERFKKSSSAKKADGDGEETAEYETEYTEDEVLEEDIFEETVETDLFEDTLKAESEAKAEPEPEPEAKDE
ncbi:MAG: AI-2E family transporter [Clostridia bacterium]|nr:AI-2E family transporter [Clostridia bacterium]